MFAGCSSSSKKIQVGDGCSLNSDCHSPLSCSFGKCHDTCKETRDCPAGQSCVKTFEGTVCLLPVESDCQSTNGVCNTGLLCAPDQRCRVACAAGTDCLTGQVCSQGVCADTNNVDPVSGQIKPGVGVSAACASNTDCNAPLTCVMGACHYVCTSTGVCPTTQSCLKTSGVGVCQLAAEAGCDSATGSGCTAGLTCASDNRCRAACRSGADCTTGQICTAGVCADSRDLSNGQLTPKEQPKLDAGAPSSDAAKDVSPSDTGSAGQTDGAADAPAGADVLATGGAPGPDAAGGTGGGAGRDGGIADLSTKPNPDTGSKPDTGNSDTPVKVTDDGGGSSTVTTGCGAPSLSKRYFCDDFESGLANWVVSGQDWNTISDSWRSPTRSATNAPNGNYPGAAIEVLAMASSVDLTTATAPVLSFWNKLTYGPGNDFDDVDVSSDGGSTWTNLREGSTKCCWVNNSSSTWTLVQLSLSNYVGKKVKIRFGYRTGNGVVAGTPGVNGWSVDDVTIQEAN